MQMKNQTILLIANAFLINFAFAAESATWIGREQVEKRYADDRKLCADEPSSSTRMQCLRDARAEYEKASSNAASMRAAEPRSCAGCGRVLSVKLIERDGEGGTAGMVAGGLVGALLGNQIGKGGTRDIATIAGAAGGAYAGSKIEQNAKSVKRWDVAVRFDNGDERTYSFDRDPGFGTGAEVKASGSSIVLR
jgi:outer membrane lipoprotein SlyB